jgi:NAD(P)-dependent dehydrogenase (short-subunit alcohol dehydrogenase family)
MVMDNSLTRPLAVVTGASSGIGYELAKQFARNGCDFLVTSTGSIIDEAAKSSISLGQLTNNSPGRTDTICRVRRSVPYRHK